MAFFPELTAAFSTSDEVILSVSDEDVPQDQFPALTSTYDVSHRFEHTAAWPERVRTVPMLNEPLDLAVPADHPLASNATVSATRAAVEPWIATHEGFPVRAIIDALATIVGRPVDVVHRVNKFTVAAELVRVGAGVALLPRWTTTTPEGVVRVRLSGVKARRCIDALVHPEKHGATGYSSSPGGIATDRRAASTTTRKFRRSSWVRVATSAAVEVGWRRGVDGRSEPELAVRRHRLTHLDAHAGGAQFGPTCVIGQGRQRSRRSLFRPTMVRGFPWMVVKRVRAVRAVS